MLGDFDATTRIWCEFVLDHVMPAHITKLLNAPYDGKIRNNDYRKIAKILMHNETLTLFDKDIVDIAGSAFIDKDLKALLSVIKPISSSIFFIGNMVEHQQNQYCQIISYCIIAFIENWTLVDRNIRQQYLSRLKEQEKTKVIIKKSFSSTKIDTDDMDFKKVKKLCANKYEYKIEDITVASKNGSVLTYWANPNLNKLSQEWMLVLNDTQNDQLHVFKIPAHSILKDDLKYKTTDLIDLQIYYGDSDFQDMRSKIKFKKWFLETIDY